MIATVVLFLSTLQSIHYFVMKLKVNFRMQQLPLSQSLYSPLMGSTSVLDKSWDNKSLNFLPATDLVALKDTSRDFSKNFVRLV